MNEEIKAGSALEDFLEQRGLTQEQTVAYLTAALDRQESLLARARAVMAAMEAIGDESFTPESLRGNPEAMRAMEEGAPVGEVYRRYYLKQAVMPRAETAANIGLDGLMGEELSPEQIERISEYVMRTGKRVEMGQE